MKRGLFFVVILMVLFCCKKVEKKEEKAGASIQVMELEKVSAGKHVLMVVAPKDFRDEEYVVPKEMLTKEGFVITTASTVTGEAKGVSGTIAKIDILLKDFNTKDYDAVVFVGGPGTPAIYDNPDAQRIAKEMVGDGKVVSAICLAPVILAKAGILNGKVSTVFPSAKGELEKAGARYQKTAVAIDGKIITANGPEAASRFAENIIKMLKTK